MKMASEGRELDRQHQQTCPATAELYDLMLSLAFFTSHPSLYSHTPLSLSWANGEGQRAAFLTTRTVCLRNLPLHRFQVGVVLFYGPDIHSGTMGTLFGIRGTPLEDVVNHDLLCSICVGLARMHRHGQGMHGGPLASEHSQGEGQPARADPTHTVTGHDFSFQTRSVLGENTSVGAVFYVDPADPRRSIREVVRLRRPF